MSRRGTTVWSSGIGRICPVCGWPADNCRCSKRSEQAKPERPTAKLRIEKKGRGGKCVTVVDGLPENGAFLQELASALKKSCATGGAVRPGAIELSGDVRDRIRPLLAERGILTKG